MVSAVYAVAWSLLLLYDGRYRDIPVLDFALPVGGLLLLLLLRCRLALRQRGRLRQALCIDGLFPGRRSQVAPILAWALPLAALASIASEGRAVIGEDFALDHPQWSDRILPIVHALWWNREMDLWALMLLLWAVPFILRSRRPTALTAD